MYNVLIQVICDHLTKSEYIKIRIMYKFLKYKKFSESRTKESRTGRSRTGRLMSLICYTKADEMLIGKPCRNKKSYKTRNYRFKKNMKPSFKNINYSKYKWSMI